MKILFLNGFSDEERQLYRGLISFCIWRNLRLLSGRAEDDELRRACPNLMREFLTVDMSALHDIVPFKDEMLQFWALPSIQRALTGAVENNLQLDNCISYFMDNLSRIASPDFSPTIEDILKVRSKTLGLVETEFVYKTMRLRIVDVGGQKNERRKWIHAFQDVTAIIFVVALNDFEYVMEEDGVTNRMQDSLVLFDQAINNKWLSKKPVVVFLNKKDLFEQALERSEERFRQVFPTCSLSKLTFEPASKYVYGQFAKKNKDPERPMYHFLTCNTDTTQVEKVFEAVSDIFLTDNLATFV